MQVKKRRARPHNTCIMTSECSNCEATIIGLTMLFCPPLDLYLLVLSSLEAEGGRERGREGGREREREGEREGGRERERERGREGGREGGRLCDGERECVHAVHQFYMDLVL